MKTESVGLSVAVSMRYAIPIALLLLYSVRSHAQSAGDSLIVHLKSGERVAIPIADIQKITFDTLSTDVVRAGSTAPSGLELSPNFPNPSINGTNIEFSIPNRGNVCIAIYDAKGNVIRRMELPHSPAGQNYVRWDERTNEGALVPSGDYFYEVRFEDEVRARKMVVIP